MDRFSETDPYDLHKYIPEAFYVEALPCESCGKPCDVERSPASWDTELLVGPCCSIASDEESPDVPRCIEEYRLIEGAQTVGELCDTIREHRKSCVICSGIRKGVQSEGGKVERREVA